MLSRQCQGQGHLEAGGLEHRVLGTGDGLERWEGGGFQNNSYVSGWMLGTWWCLSWEKKIVWG